MLSHKIEHILRTTLLAILLLLAGWSCRKDVEIFRPYAISVAEITLALQQVPAAQTQSVLQLSNRHADTLFVTPSGIRIFMHDLDNLFADAAGIVVPCSTCPDFRLEVVEIKQKGDLVARHTGTITAENRVLESGGILYLRASCGSGELQLIQGKSLKIQIPSEQPFFANQLFVNTSSSGDTFSGWTGVNLPVTVAEWQVPGGSSVQVGYQLLSPSLHWVCAGRMLEEPNSRYCMELPLGFSDQNTQAFLVFKTKRCVVPMNYVSADFQFCADFTPEGFPVQVVTLTKVGGQFWLGRQDTETGSTSVLTIQPQQLTEQQVIDFIKNL